MMVDSAAEEFNKLSSGPKMIPVSVCSLLSYYMKLYHRDNKAWSKLTLTFIARLAK